MKHYTVVEVCWDDASIDTDDFDRDEALKSKPVRRWTTGYFIEDKDDCLVLATDFYENEKKEEFAAMMKIPHGMIVEWWDRGALK